MLGYARTCAAVSLAAVAVATVLCLVLIPLFGTIGAAGAMTVALSLRALALSLAARRHLGFGTHVLA
jgi:O-antigen/teichoic acid export membrane protein